jgi:hypothetical protein
MTDKLNQKGQKDACHGNRGRGTLVRQLSETLIRPQQLRMRQEMDISGTDDDSRAELFQDRKHQAVHAYGREPLQQYRTKDADTARDENHE